MCRVKNGQGHELTMHKGKKTTEWDENNLP